MTVLVLVLLSASLASPPDAAQAPKWKEIGKTSVGNPVYVDPKSVKKGSDGIITATLRAVFVKPVATPKGQPITASKTTAMFDCTKKLVAVKENIYFHDEKTNSVYQRSAPGKPGFGTTIKGSLPDLAMTYLCSTSPNGDRRP